MLYDEASDYFKKHFIPKKKIEDDNKDDVKYIETLVKQVDENIINYQQIEKDAARALLHYYFFITLPDVNHLTI